MTIRPLAAADAPACDEAVRSSAGLVAARDGQVVGFLTVEHHFEAASEITWMAVHARHQGRRLLVLPLG